MKQYIISAIVACLAMTLHAYDQFNPNPSNHDVWEARNRAWESRQSALRSSNNRDSAGWQKHSQDAWLHERNANEMEFRMRQNERQRAYEQNQERYRMMQQDDENDEVDLSGLGLSASQIMHMQKKMSKKNMREQRRPILEKKRRRGR